MDPTTDLRITSRPLGGDTAVEVHGELDMATASVLRENLLDVLHHQGPRIIVDMAGVSFCDATGLAVLVATERRARLLGGIMRLAAPRDQVIRVLRATSLDRHFRIYPTTVAAGRLSDRLRPDLGRDSAALPAPQLPLDEPLRAWEHRHADEIREAVGDVLAYADAWHAADPERWLTRTLGDLASAYGGTDPATLTRAARALMAALTRHPLTPTAPVVESGTQLRHLLDGRLRPTLLSGQQ